MPNAFQMPHKCEMFSLQLCRDEKGPVSESTDGDLLCPDIVVAPCAWPGLGPQAAKVNEAQSRRFKPSGCDRLKHRSLGSDVVGAMAENLPGSRGRGQGWAPTAGGA